MTRVFAKAFSVAAIVAAGAFSAHADSGGITFSPGDKFTETSGEALYKAVCQTCHMNDGQGAVGAGAYPALAKNENLSDASYPISMVINGQGAMPPFGGSMDDDQIAAVVGYVRTHFGNDYKDPVAAGQVKASR